MSANQDEHERRLKQIRETLGIGDAGTPDADAAAKDRSSEHAARREEFCTKKCKADASCRTACATAYNACGMDGPSDTRADEFRRCVQQIKAAPR